jgi:hypothetical protein
VDRCALSAECSVAENFCLDVYCDENGTEVMTQNMKNTKGNTKRNKE